LKILREF